MCHRFHGAAAQPEESTNFWTARKLQRTRLGIVQEGRVMNACQLAKGLLEKAQSLKPVKRFCLRGMAGLLAGIVFLALPLNAQNGAGDRSVDGIYSGTIGDQQIVVELRGTLEGKYGENYANAEDSHTYPIRGSYFYRRHGVSIELLGTPLGDSALRLREYRHIVAADEFTAEWRITMREGKATGTFCKCDLGRPSASAEPRLNISLTRVSKELSPDSGWENYKPNSGNTYYDLLLDFPLQPGREIRVGPQVTYRMRTDARFRVSRPQLMRFPKAAVMAEINRDLDADLTHNRLWAAAVLSGGESGARFGGIYDEKTTVNVFLPHILSVLVETEWFSGGAHPNEGGYSLNYDLHTGKRFDLEEAFQTSPGNEAESGAVLAELYLRHYVKPPAGEAAVDDCEKIVSESVSRKDVPFRPLLYLSKEGLAIEPPLPHAVQACGPGVTVPYRELQPFVKSGSPLRSLVDARASN